MTEDMIEQALSRGQMYHDVFDTAKTWSRDTAAELRVRAALEDDEETAAEIIQAATLVQTVVERIEQGDTTRARNPQERR